MMQKAPSVFQPEKPTVREMATETNEKGDETNFKKSRSARGYMYEEATQEKKL
jgi:hypothetical protein